MHNRTFRWALLIALLSGRAALSHELLWSRRLIDLLGASNESIARVFGCFFLGLAAGAAWATRLIPNLQRPWRAVGLVEIGIGLAALPAMTLPHWTSSFWPALGSENLVGWIGTILKLFLSVLVVFPPAFLMGMTLPLMARGVLRGRNTLARQGTWLYAVNTAGGVLGLALTVGFTLATLGSVAGAMSWTIALNLIIGLLALWLDRSWQVEAVEQQPTVDATVDLNADSSGDQSTTMFWLLLLAFCSGFAVLAMEIVSLQLIHNVLPSTMYSTSGVLATFIVLLTFSAAVTPWFVAVWGPRKWLLIVTSCSAITTALAPWLFTYVTHGLEHLDDTRSLATFLWQLVFTLGVTLGPGLLLAGFVLPATFAWHQTNDADPYGVRWGWLLAVNGVGGLCGAELSSSVMIPWLGMHCAAGSIAIGYALLACGMLWLGAKQFSLPYSVLVMVSLIVSVGVGWMVSTRLPLLHASSSHEVVSLKSGREGVVAIVRQTTDRKSWGMSIVHNNQFCLGSTGGTPSQRRKVLLPLILHSKPSHVGVIGMATGITAGAALDHPDVEQLVAIEISPLVAQAAAEHFASENRHISTDARATVVVEDGRTYIASANSQFDVIVGDLFRPWNPGVGRLYSAEHFRNVGRALRPGGMFCQWLPMYQLADPEFRTIVATFAEVFPRTHIIRGSFSSSSPSIALVGFPDSDIDWAGLAERAQRMRASSIDDPVLRVPGATMMHYLGYLSSDEQFYPVINTLDNAWIEVQAARTRVSRIAGAPYLHGEPWLQMESGLIETLELPPEVRSQPHAWRVLGQQISQLHFLQRINAPTAAEVRANALEAIPAELFSDRDADWSSWPIRP